MISQKRTNYYICHVSHQTDFKKVKAHSPWRNYHA